MRVSVIIVSYNVRHFLDVCLHSVLRAAEGLEAEVVVVDNASKDDSVAWVREQFPTVKLIANTDNTGFSKANNQGVAASTGEFILFLNPDTVMPEDFFRKTLAYMDAHPEAGALGPRLIDGKGSFAPDSKKGFPSFAIAFFKTTGLHKLAPRSPVINGYYAPQVGEWETAPVDVLSGCCMLVRRSVIDAVGGAFDERFFMYCEDVDLSYRISQGGWKNVYFPEASLIHYKGESTRKATLSYIRIFNEALAAFVRKHYSKRSARVFIFLLHLGIAFRAVIGAFRAVLRTLRLPLLDALLLLLTLLAIKEFWVVSVKGVPPISLRLVALTFPAYILTWIGALFLNGAYDPAYRPLRVVRGMLVGTVVALAYYGLLPPDMRYSRGIIVFGGITGTVVLLGIHAILQRVGLTGQVPYDAAARQAVIVGSAAAAADADGALRRVTGAPNIAGRVGLEAGALAPVEELKPLLQTAGIGEVIFCTPDLSYSEVLQAMQDCGPEYDYKLHLPHRSGFVGSNSSNAAGELYTADPRYRLSDPAYRRQKRTFDVLASGLMLLLFPLLAFVHPRPGSLWNKIWTVLAGRQSWVGYGAGAPGLPPLKSGVFPPYVLVEGYLPAPAVQATLDRNYALYYVPGRDLTLLLKNFRAVGRK